MELRAKISFPGISDAEANKLAGSLDPTLRSTDKSVAVKRERINPEAQDGGAILAIILGSAAVSSVAKGIAMWLARNSGTMIEIHRADGSSVKIKHASGHDTAQTVEAAFSNKG
ncbi:MAG: hypothetical protein JWQ42_1163 [Edaphobacter sp.]|nr:hypothetical protein [Edaphobacter sp.]